MITSSNDSIYKSFQATGTAIAAGRRVKIDTDRKISLAGNNDAIGVTVDPVAADGVGTVRMWGPTVKVTALTAFARAAALYPAANGKVDDAVVGNPLGLVALDAATADGDTVEAAEIR